LKGDLQFERALEERPMAELITITLSDGKTEIINLDYVMRIQPIDEKTSSIAMTDGSRTGPMAVRGNPAQIASAHRIAGS
jgi:hypothetical protein